MIGLVVRGVHQKDMCYDEIKSCVYNINIIMLLIVNTTRRRM